MELRKTNEFADWIDELKDLRARARIQVRIERLKSGNPGDIKSVGDGVSELRINYGPGYRVYLKKYGAIIIILLAGGTKQTQSRDIKKAKMLAQLVEGETK
ncbi:MAG: type II toxin-antitoxin system RelE/ParE family toxin [Deltaproteobacteria bacterium]|nr:type II toxin-antitoxin system RelE/ParE family toxin [Deltaproteobacteria bacterium]